MKKLFLLLFSLMLSFNSYSEVTYTKVGSIFYGSDGSKCEVDYLGDMDCSAQLGRSQSLTDDAGNAGESMGQAFGEIFNALFGGNSNNQRNSTIPENAYATSGATQGWKCKSGYGIVGYEASNGISTQRCVKAPCDIGYFKDKSTNACMKVPENAAKYSGAESWYCKSGYRKSLDKCIKK